MNQPASNDNTVVALTHIGGIFFSFIPSLIVWLVYKDKNGFVEEQAKEALNFQITMAIGFFVLFISIIGILLIWVLGVINLVLCILAAVKTSNGEQFRYPFALRLIK